jgi:hypothetical protein
MLRELDAASEHMSVYEGNLKCGSSHLAERRQTLFGYIRVGTEDQAHEGFVRCSGARITGTPPNEASAYQSRPGDDVAELLSGDVLEGDRLVP